MAKEFTFDVVSDFDRQEVVNAVDQAQKEVANRYDFKGSDTEIDLEKEAVSVKTASELHLKSVRDILESKFFRRGLDLRVLEWGEVEPASKGAVKQSAKLKKGISEDIGRELSKHIRTAHPKVHVQIQGDQLRVAGKDKDSLQAVIQDLKDGDYGVPLQFTNYR